MSWDVELQRVFRGVRKQRIEQRGAGLVHAESPLSFFGFCENAIELSIANMADVSITIFSRI
jgi:hypothetical protein